ncbi:MAG: PIN domain-containing protein [Proteobacteria bacterium]|nr:PIN domain-containing protein [Pseudomonadota bacterium]
MKLSSTNAPLKPSTKALSEQIIAIGVKPFDALHAAVAIENNVRFFCTCDDKLLKKLRTLDFGDKTKFVSPLELIIEVTS